MTVTSLKIVYFQKSENAANQVAKEHYHSIYRALRKYTTPSPAISDMRYRQSLAPEVAQCYYQEAIEDLSKVQI